jgi:hypothetical protein
VNFERVLLVKDGDKLSIGQPYVQGTFVFAFPPHLSVTRPSVEQPEQPNKSIHPYICDTHAMQRVVGLHRGLGAGDGAGGVPRKEADCLQDEVQEALPPQEWPPPGAHQVPGDRRDYVD